VVALSAVALLAATVLALAASAALHKAQAWVPTPSSAVAAIAAAVSTVGPVLPLTLCEPQACWDGYSDASTKMTV
jgi:hypothetical protein